MSETPRDQEAAEEAERQLAAWTAYAHDYRQLRHHNPGPFLGEEFLDDFHPYWEYKLGLFGPEYGKRRVQPSE